MSNCSANINIPKNEMGILNATQNASLIFKKIDNNISNLSMKELLENLNNITSRWTDNTSREKFQNYNEFEWLVKSSNDWRLRPKDCFQTKYELKSINQKRKPSWFIFKKK